jgi:uroporphyrinogen-III synthase
MGEQTKRPLEGRRIVITRSPQQSQELAEGIARAGGTAVFLPMLRFGEPLDFAGIDFALRSLGSFDWLFFMSQNAVRFVMRRLHVLGIELPQSGRPAIAAVGPATARTATEEGWKVDYVARRNTGNGLVEELASSVKGRRVLLPRSDRGNPELSQALRTQGADVTQVIAYRTLPLEPWESRVLADLAQGAADVITFASPSAVQLFLEAVGPEKLPSVVGRTKLAAIGPTTAAMMAEIGLPVAIQASEASSEGFVQAVVALFAKSAPGTRPA